MFDENGPVENLQVICWCLSLVLGLVIAFKPTQVRDRVFGAWLALLAGLAILRELDRHVLLNPETLGEWGVRYRIDWWLSAETPVLVRLVWLVAGAALLTSLILPFTYAAPKFVVHLRARDGAWWLLTLAVAALFLGYAFDDLLGRDQFVASSITKAVEESFELLGAGLWTAGLWSLRRVPLHRREQLAIEHTTPPGPNPHTTIPP